MNADEWCVKILHNEVIIGVFVEYNYGSSRAVSRNMLELMRRAKCDGHHLFRKIFTTKENHMCAKMQ